LLIIADSVSTTIADRLTGEHGVKVVDRNSAYPIRSARDRM
jgi:hypothetical protein